MFLRIRLWWHMLTLSVRLMWRNRRCARLGREAIRRRDEISGLTACIGKVFMSADRCVTGVGWHVQQSEGYAVNEAGQRSSGICWEAPICITVYHSGQPLVGMAFELEGDVLSIRQFQGVSGIVIPLELHKWPAMFVEAVKAYLAEDSRITSVRLYDADQRVSYRHPVAETAGFDLKKYRQSLRRRYDGTARQQKFTKTDGGYWEWRHSGFPV